MRKLVLLLLGFSLWASVAHATPTFIATNDLCQIDTATSGDQNYWTTINGTPSISATKDSTTGNLCSVKFDPTINAAEYVAKTISSTSTPSVCVRFYVTTPPTTRRKILSFRSTNDSKNGAMLTIERDPVLATRFRVKAFYESSDTSSGECSASRTQDGKECNSAADCDYVNSGEQTCAPGVFAATPKLSTLTWYIACLKQENLGGGSVKVTLWQGTAGANPSVYQRGAQTRSQGQCTGGANDLNACSVSSECPSGSCTTTDVVTIEEVRFGTDETTISAATDFLLDDMIIDPDAVNPNYRIETSQPSGAGTQADFSGAYTDIDDGVSPDGNTTKIEKANATGCDASCTGGTECCYFDAATQDPSSGTILGVSLTALAQDTENASGRTMNLRLDVFDGSLELKGTNFDMETFSDEGSSAAYHQLPAIVFATKPAGGSWDATAANALQIRVERNSSTHTSNAVRVTSAIAEFALDLSDPSLPNKAPDRNQDGEKTLCLYGDSTFNDAGFQDEVVAGSLEFTNILDCSRGGATPGDITENCSISGSNNDMFEGGTSQFLSCRALKGTAPKGCDVIVMEIGVNALHSGVTANPNNMTDENGVSGKYPGFCDSKGGTNDQGPCSCPNGQNHRRSDSTASDAYQYCRTKGATWRMPCDAPTDCEVASAAECCTDCADTNCATCTNTASPSITSNLCDCAAPYYCIGCSVNTSAQNASTMCVPGCVDSPQCPNGICIQHDSVSDVMREIHAIQDKRALLPTPVPTPPTGGPPIIIYSFPPLPATKNGLGCWQDSEREVSNLRSTLLEEVKSKGLPYINMYDRFLRDCPNGSVGTTSCQTNGCTYGLYPTCFGSVCIGGTNQGSACSTSADCGDRCLFDRGCCLRDEIHWNANYGQLVAAAAIVDCVTNVGDVTSDGTCVSNICTTGRINEPCPNGTNSECNTWSCDLLSAVP